MRDICVWAYHQEFGTLCRDAGLGSDAPLQYPNGNGQGQAGWHVAVRFRDLADLAGQLGAGLPMPSEFCGRWFGRDCDPIARGEIVRLALMAHGDQGGQMAINGRNRLPFLTADTVASFHADLHTVGLSTRQTATILLMGCLAGQGREGTRLLMALSAVWPGRNVVGFSTVGYRHSGEMKRRGDACELPGLRDTGAPAELFANPHDFDALWRDLVAMPWGSEQSLHAKVVQSGSVSRWPPDEIPVPAAPQREPAPPLRQGSREGARNPR